MVNPVPGYKITTRFRATSQNNWKACGFHTGQDYAAPRGTPVVAARAGTVRHVSAGAAFGPYAFVVDCPDGTADFYAHTLDRPANGTRVAAGQRLARVGALGNATGPHLHFERWEVQARDWPSCTQFDDPMRSHNEPAGAPGSPWASGAVYVSKLRVGQHDSDSVKRLQYRLNALKVAGAQPLPITGNYLSQTDSVVRKWQASIGNTVDPVGRSSVGPKQARRLFPAPYTVIE